MKHRLLTGLAVAPLTLAVLTAGPAGAVAGVRVTTLSGAQGWRVSPSNTGEVAISGAVDDPVRKDGSLRLDNLAGGARAQAQLPLVAPLGKVAGSRIAYSAYVASGADPQYGVNLQLEIAGGNFYTTLSYQPHLDGGLGTGTWRTFANRRGAAVWWSSRAFGAIPANKPVTLADVVAAEGPNAHVINVYLNVSAALDAYADNVAVDGVRYNFAATPKPLTVTYDMRCEEGGGGTVAISAANNTASTQRLDVQGAGLTPHTLRISVPPNGKATKSARIGTAPTVVTARRVGGGSKSATLRGCPEAGKGTAPEQSGDLTPGVPGKAGGGFAAESGRAESGRAQSGRPVLAAAVTEPAKQAAHSVGTLAGSMVAGAGVAFAGTAMVRRRKGARR
ncbi:hypothetical protein KGQ19_31365 [Catenulispora sp. NL8]|uniref:Uncharacterized protein n=1 Tax=Catenulispora pinistramenti TaxID=2705254 RepID=A0ABS5KZA4_9ACTN|nr:hypothetical protein [Catenulispora pinistramenti]MBS2551378.1 hypothetical protein [Catenulispora pinistramenti]